jgi:putative hydrolase of the HAD superfamily
MMLPIPMVYCDIQAVYFDAVGTLLIPDPPAEEVYVAVGRAYGIPAERTEVRQRLCSAFAEQEEQDRQRHWKVDAAREEQRWRAIVQYCLPTADPQQGEALFRQLFDHFAHPDAWRLDPEAPTVLEELHRRGLNCGIASNYDARLRSVIAGFPELARLQQRLVISAEVGYRKPAAAFFQALAQQAGCPPSQILYVGDDPVLDVQAARAAGVQALWYQPPQQNAANPPLRRTLQSPAEELPLPEELKIQHLSQILPRARL